MQCCSRPSLGAPHGPACERVCWTVRCISHGQLHFCVEECSHITPRAQAVGVDSSTKLSPFVTLGCTTPRLIHAEVEAVRRRADEHRQRQGQGQGDGEAAEDNVPAPAECDWLDMHLCIRCVPHGSASWPSSAPAVLPVTNPPHMSGVEGPCAAQRWVVLQTSKWWLHHESPERWAPQLHRLQASTGPPCHDCCPMLLHTMLKRPSIHPPYPVARDFFILTALKAGGSVMRPGGLQGQEVAWRHDEEAFRRCGGPCDVWVLSPAVLTA